jgi:hypothetical protein
MSRRPFDPNELDQPASDADSAIRELQHYAMTTDADGPRGLSDRIMASIEQEPTPRRGLLAWLTASSPGGGPGRFVRFGAVAATLVLAVAGALFAGQLADLVRDVGADRTPTPSLSPSPSEAPSLSPVPSSSVAPSPLATPDGSDDNGGVAPTMVPSTPLPETANPEDTPEESTPRPSATATASPTSTPTETP